MIITTGHMVFISFSIQYPRLYFYYGEKTDRLGQPLMAGHSMANQRNLLMSTFNKASVLRHCAKTDQTEGKREALKCHQSLSQCVFNPSSLLDVT